VVFCVLLDNKSITSTLDWLPHYCLYVENFENGTSIFVYKCSSIKVYCLYLYTKAEENDIITT
jgi:hypothetical protein